MKRGTWERALHGAAIVAGVCAGLASAQPALDPIVDKHWSRFVGGRQLKPVNHPQHRGDLTAWNTVDSLYLMPFDFSFCLIGCGDCGFTGAKPHRFVLPFRKSFVNTMPFAVITQTGAKAFPTGGAVSAVVVFALPNRELHRLKVAWSEAGAVTQEKWDTTLLDQPPGSGPILPSMVIAASDVGPLNENSFVVMGLGGYGRWVTWTATGKAETMLNLPKVTFTARRGRFLGTSDGEVWAWSDFPAMTLQAKPFDGPVQAIDSQGAIGPEQRFAYRLGDRWRTDYDATSGLHPVSWNLEWDSLGLLGSFWTPTTKPLQPRSTNAEPIRKRLSDAATRIASVQRFNPELIMDGKAIFIPQIPVEFSVTLSDSEGNFDAPEIMRIRLGDTVLLSQGMRKTVPGWGEGSWPTRGLGCANDGACLTGDTPTAVFRSDADSMRISIPAFKGALDKMCMNMPYFRRSLDQGYRIATDFRDSDKIRVRFGRDNLFLIPKYSMGLVDRAAWWLHGTGAELRSGFDAAGRKLSLKAGAGGVKGRVPATPRFPR